jgi:ABC-2 type transport system ATP-binding protein
VHHPLLETTAIPGRLVVLDEPTNDVDPMRRRLLRDVIRHLVDDGAGVLLVTHNVREAGHVVDHLVILDNGRVLAAGGPAGLASSMLGTLTVELDLAPGADLMWQLGVSKTARGRLRAAGMVRSEAAADIVRWAQTQVDAWTVERYSLTAASLEDVYLRLTGSAELQATGTNACPEVVG